jgi:ribosome maturation factor RimP
MSGQNYFHRQAEDVPKETIRESERESTIRRIAEPLLSSLGLVLVDIELRGRGGNSLLRVVIEGPPADGEAAENVTIKDCERAHVLIGHALDVEDPIPHAYVLEVSSPGLDRPIRTATDYERFQGRLARFKLAKPIDGQAVLIGRIGKLEGRQLWIETAVKGRRRRSTREREAMAIALAMDDIQEARLEVEF